MHDERCAESRMGHDGQQRAPNQNHQAAGERDRAGSVQGRLGGERMTFDQLAGEFERDQFAGLAENTVKSHRAYLRHLKAFFGLSRLSQLPRPHSALADRTPKESASVWPCNFPLRLFIETSREPAVDLTERSERDCDVILAHVDAGIRHC